MVKIKEFYPEGWIIDTLENKRKISSPTTLSEAMVNKDILEANVTMCDSEHNLVVDLGSMKGIIERDDGAIGIKEGKVRDIALISKVGKPVSFIVTDILTDNSGKLYAKLSRKAAQEAFLQNFSSNYSPGHIINARVTHLENFGAFCDIGCGVISLLPIDNISVSRISHPKDRFKVGDDLRVVIKTIDSDGKITLTHKELLGTWEENADFFKEGQTVSGLVRSVENYGIFVELSPNLAGLAEYKENVLPGMTAGVYIKSIIKEKMKVKLIIVESFFGGYNPHFDYFYDGTFIKKWQYSPKNCIKDIYTDFLS